MLRSGPHERRAGAGQRWRGSIICAFMMCLVPAMEPQAAFRRLVAHAARGWPPLHLTRLTCSPAAWPPPACQRAGPAAPRST